MAPPRGPRSRGNVAQPHQASVEIDIGHLGEQDTDICAAAKDPPQRISDLRWRERAGRHLVGQRLKQVKVASIDQRDVHWKPGEVQGRLDPAEPAAADDDMGAISDTGLHECHETVYPRRTQSLIRLARSSRPIVSRHGVARTRGRGPDVARDRRRLACGSTT